MLIYDEPLWSGHLLVPGSLKVGCLMKVQLYYSFKLSVFHISWQCINFYTKDFLTFETGSVIFWLISELKIHRFVFSIFNNELIH